MPDDELMIGQEQAPNYREKMLGRIKAVKPEYEPADDEDMLKEIEALYSETESKKGEYEGFAKSITDLTNKDPRFAAVIEIMRDPENPKTFGYAFSKVYGKDFLSAEDEDIEKGEMEYSARMEELKKAQESAGNNFKQYIADLDKVASEKGLSEDEKETVHSAIMTDAENYLNGIIPASVVEDKIKAMNYDKDIMDAADAGRAEGKNEQIDMKFKKPVGMPDMGAATGAGQPGKFVKKMSPLDKFKQS